MGDSNSIKVALLAFSGDLKLAYRVLQGVHDAPEGVDAFAIAKIWRKLKEMVRKRFL